MGRRINYITGHKFNKTKLTYISDAGHHIKPNGDSVRLVKCQCDCGNVTVLRVGDIKSGNTRSCGMPPCDNRTQHGEVKSILYRRWDDMKSRVMSGEYYKHISIYEPWMNYSNFKKWALSNGFDEKNNITSLERTDSKKNYEPSNCCFILSKHQNKNRSNCKWWYVDGVKYETAELAATSHNVDRTTIMNWCEGRLVNKVRNGERKNNCWSVLKYPK